MCMIRRCYTRILNKRIFKARHGRSYQIMAFFVHILMSLLARRLSPSVVGRTVGEWNLGSLLRNLQAKSCIAQSQDFTAAGRQTGEMVVNGFKQDLRTFKRVSGYCEQTDIHSPQSTVQESLWFSARLRLSPDVPSAKRKAFMEEVRFLSITHTSRETTSLCVDSVDTLQAHCKVTRLLIGLVSHAYPPLRKRADRKWDHFVPSISFFLHLGLLDGQLL